MAMRPGRTTRPTIPLLLVRPVGRVTPTVSPDGHTVPLNRSFDRMESCAHVREASPRPLMFRQLTASLVFALLAAACGGGGGVTSSGPPVAAATPAPPRPNIVLVV